ncbi:MAG: biopolymer transporter ExbD [bacterium]|nr:biopolymer transporter ExbD [bacterium]
MRRPRHRTYTAMADINITNLVDVVLVLLIIFMISAPLLQSGIDINLPTTRAAPVEEDAEGVVVTIDDKGGIYINDIWARMDNFEEALEAELRKKNTASVYIRADSSVVYGTAISVIGRLKEMGIEGIGLITEPVQEKKGKR